MEDHLIHQNRIRQVFFLAAIVLWGVLLAMELYSFLPALLGAITLYIILRKYMIMLVEGRKWKPGAAAGVLMLLTFLVILIPIGLLVHMLSSKITYAIQHSNELVEALKIVISDVEQRLGIVVVNPDNLNKLGGFVAQAAPKVLNATFGTLITIFFMYFILFFMLVNGRKMERGIYDYIPLKDENVDKLGREMQNIVLSNAIGIPMIAILQGIVAIIGYYLLGVKEPWFWFVVTCITAMLPFIGAALAYVPLAIIFFANDQALHGIIMLIFGFGVIGTVDNIFRFTLARKIGNVHPLITVFGVLIGIKLFGFVGLIFGPVLISMFILLLKIYSNEFMVRKQEIITK
ncbi:MAG: AI-2E family transporter [Bacteroidota bacterium]|nr:AI-2E family transporter [Bacteroidota bacterium]